MAMRIRRYGAERIAQYGRSRATLDATFGNYLPRIAPAAGGSERHGHRFWRKKTSCGVLEIAFQS